MKGANETGAGPSSSPSWTPTNSETEAQDFGNLRHGNQNWGRSQHESSEVDAGNIRRDDDEIEVEKLGSPTDDDFSSSSGSVSEHEIRSGRSSHSGRPEVARTVSQVRDGIESRHDVEAALPLEKQPTPRHLADPNLVTWNTEDPENPKTWETGQKWAAVFVVSTFTLISPVSSTMTAPALGSIASELNITNEFEKQLSLSIFVLAYAIGPLLLGPLSELYGRVIVLQLANLFYLFFNLGCGLCHTKVQLIVFRFLAGFGGSAPLAIGGGVLSDLFTAEERGRAMSIYSLAPLLGPAIGPIAGAFISENTSWRWIFYATTIADAMIQCAGLFLLRETYTPVLLRWRKEKLIKETGNTDLHTDFDDPDKTVSRTLATAFVRPFRMLFTQPIIQVLALYMMFLYGLMYLILSTFPGLWASYGMSTGIGGLNYIALGLGFFLGAQICAPFQDRIYARLKKHYNVSVGRPEFRIPMMVPGAILMPVGLVIYGWTAQYRVHWIGPDIGVVILSMGVIIGFQAIQGFLVDSYTRYAASAVAAATVLRSLAGFGFPLFAPSLYAKLDYGWGNTMLAFIGVVIGWPGPILLWKYGQQLREKSTFAAGPR
ncbi:major facilitator superfamily transporter [Diaporthe eres]|nr:major facilitator superfamily transporter [Diaporthe eres]